MLSQLGLIPIYSLLIQYSQAEPHYTLQQRTPLRPFSTVIHYPYLSYNILMSLIAYNDTINMSFVAYPFRYNHLLINY